ncbi:MAG: dynamin family protein [Campylobacter sp.]|nr:dynamin family protein [Campylobacter sp.]
MTNVYSCDHDIDATHEIFEFINYSSFINKQTFKYKNKDLSGYYTYVYNTLTNQILRSNANNDLHRYAIKYHDIALTDNQISLEDCIGKIKKHFLFGNKIDYRFLLLSQLLHGLNILNIKPSEPELGYLKSTLKLSNKEFDKAIKYAENQNAITDDKIANTFIKFADFTNRQKRYKETNIKHIGICANMSSGKSTFVNALLGYDYLPARNEATTACITSVYDWDFATRLLGVATKENKIYSISDDANTKTIDAWNAEAEHIVLQADLDNISNSNFIVAVHDTPGVNNGSNDEHKKVTMEFFKNNKMDLILYVANAEHLATDDDKALLNELKERILPNSKAKVIFVINKFDCIDTQKENKDKIIAKYKDFLANLGYENPQIYPLSSKAARLFKMAIKNKTNLFSRKENSDFRLLLDTFTQMDKNVGFEGEQAESSKLHLALKNTGLSKLEQNLQDILKKD